MKVKSFTLLEVVIAVVIISILASLSIFVYDKTRDTANQKVCEQNQLINNATLKMYLYEYNTVPGSLGEIPDRFYDKAFAKIMNDEPLFMAKRRLYFAIINFAQPKMAIAQISFSTFAGTKQSLVCPADANGLNPPGNYSYAISAALITAATAPGGSAINAYKTFVTNDQTIICDSEKATFSSTVTGITPGDLALRHGGILQDYAIAVTAGGSKLRLNEAGNPISGCTYPAH